MPSFTRLVSTGSKGIGNGDSSAASISADGRFIAFASLAFNLSSGDVNNAVDLFVKDMLTGAVTIVSTGPNGLGNDASFSPALSGDGRYVSFASDATNLGGSSVTEQVYLKDLQTNTLTELSTGSGTGIGEGNGPSSAPSLGTNANGLVIAFASLASNLVQGASNGVQQIYVEENVVANIGTRRILVPTKVLVSGDTSNNPGNNFSFNPVVSANGRYVAFETSASNFSGSDQNGVEDIYVKDLQTNVITPVSTGAAGFGNLNSIEATISGDGRYIAFASDANNLVVGDTNGVSDIFVKDTQSGTITLASAGANGIGNGISDHPSISADGRFITFESAANNLVTDQTNGVINVFIKDLVTGKVTLVSNHADHDSVLPKISAMGTV